MTPRSQPFGSSDATLDSNAAPSSLSAVGVVAYPKRGLRFFHAHFLNEERDGPMEFVVTRVARGVVYYRPADGGSPMKCGLEEFPRYAKQGEQS
jgi:hypothetical protein